MKNLRKITLFTLALATVATASLAVACQNGGGNSSSSPSSGDPLDISARYPDTYPQAGHNGADCSFGEWELVEEPDCTKVGVKVRRCTLNAEHVDYEAFAARGHNYGDTGVCTTCEAEASIPAPNKNAYYYNLATDGFQGAGEEYDRYRVAVSEDEYYEVQMGGSDIWFEFGVSGPGQYAVVSTSNAGGVEIARFDASTQYITPIPYPGRVLSDGNFISTVHCSSVHWSTNWTAVFRLSGNTGSTVKFYVVKIAEAPWTSKTITIDVEATQASETKAENGPTGTVPTVVPYDSNYFYDEETGYYRLGNAANPGRIIYAAITANATRLMGEMSFVGLPQQGSPITLDGGQTVEGDHIKYDYLSFIGETVTDPNSASGTVITSGYGAVVNDDGLHPVTQELYDFLQAYTAENSIATPPGSANATNAWLAPCYYYANLTQGEAAFPFEVKEFGSFVVTPITDDYVYYTFKPNVEIDSTAIYCSITVRDNVRLHLNGKTYDNNSAEGVNEIKDLIFELDPETGVLLEFLNRDFSLDPIQVTILAVEGSLNNPIEIETLGEVTFTPIELLDYNAYYSYTATADGTLYLTTSSDTLTLNGVTVPADGEPFPLSLTAGETAIIQVSATSADPVNATLTFIEPEDDSPAD